MDQFKSNDGNAASAFVDRAIQSLEKTLGAPLADIIKDQDLDSHDKRAKLRPLVVAGLAARFNVTQAEIAAAISASSGSVEALPNLYLGARDVDNIVSATGDGIIAAVTYYVNALLQMSEAETPAELLAVSLPSGILAVGVPMAISIAKEIAKDATMTVLKAGLNFLTSTAGIFTAVVAVVVLLLEVLLFLASIQRDVVGLVVNRSDRPIYVQGWQEGGSGQAGYDLYMKHGDLTGFMFDLNEGYNLGTSYVLGDEAETVMTAVGIVRGSKRTGFYGVEGYMILRTDAQGDGPGLVGYFGNPYSAPSGVSTKAITGRVSDQDRLYDELYESSSVGPRSTSTGGLQLTMTMNSTSGKVAYFVSVVEPA